ncbi:MAG: hypothetical protein ABIR28_12970, partial [Vicinamibacteria bacterium]
MLSPPDPLAPSGVNPASAYLGHALADGPRRFDPVRRDAIWLVGATALSYPIGLALEPRFLLPVLNAAPAWWLMTR